MAGLSQQAILDYQAIYKKEFGKDISYDQAQAKGMELLKLFGLIYKPIPKRWIDKKGKNGKK